MTNSLINNRLVDLMIHLQVQHQLHLMVTLISVLNAHPATVHHVQCRTIVLESIMLPPAKNIHSTEKQLNLDSIKFKSSCFLDIANEALHANQKAYCSPNVS
jgi:hypothetical protein